MIKLLEIGRHVWVKGHSIDVKRYATQLSRESGNGWLMKCSCGKTWSK